MTQKEHIYTKALYCHGKYTCSVTVYTSIRNLFLLKWICFVYLLCNVKSNVYIYNTMDLKLEKNTYPPKYGSTPRETERDSCAYLLAEWSYQSDQ